MNKFDFDSPYPDGAIFYSDSEDDPDSSSFVGYDRSKFHLGVAAEREKAKIDPENAVDSKLSSKAFSALLCGVAVFVFHKMYKAFV